MNVVSILPQFIVFPVIIAALLLVALLLLVVDLILYSRDKDKDTYWSYQRGWGKAALAVTIANAVLVGLPAALLPIPYNPIYHHLYSVSGTVSEVTTVIKIGGDYVTDQYVVQIEGDENQYILSDPRASLLEGTDVTLSCTYEWVQFGTDRINCLINN